MAGPASQAELERAALHIVRLIADTRNLRTTKLAVIGDLAVCKYLPQHAVAKSIEFIVSKSSVPSRVTKEILAHPMTPLVEKSKAMFYRHTDGWEVEVKMTPEWLCPYMPEGAQSVQGLKALPYIKLEDLVVFKADACSIRESAANKRQEARETAALLQLASEHSPLDLDDNQSESITQALEDVIEFSAPEHDKNWWHRRLGMPLDKRVSVQDMLADLADNPPMSPTSTSRPGTSSASSSNRSSIYSTMSRTPSSSTFSSNHSSSSSISSAATSPLEEHPPSTKAASTKPRKMSVTNSPRHRRNLSAAYGGVPTSPTPVETMFKNLDINRPDSPGVALSRGV